MLGVAACASNLTSLFWTLFVHIVSIGSVAIAGMSFKVVVSQIGANTEYFRSLLRTTVPPQDMGMAAIYSDIGRSKEKQIKGLSLQLQTTLQVPVTLYVS